MKKIPYNFDWQFSEGAGRFMMNGADAGEKVDLPHDYVINKPRSADSPGGASTGFFPSGLGSYSKTFAMDKDWYDKTVLLSIDGAYMNSEVFLNDDKLYHHPYGYSAYQVDLTALLRSDAENNLRISTQSLQPSSRWYSGGGLYRDVSLWVGGKCYIHPWDVFITTPEASRSKAVVHITIEVSTNLETGLDGELEFYILTETGATVATAKHTAQLNPEKKTPLFIDMAIQKPMLWDVDEPHLYKLRSVLKISGDEVDVDETMFGIRSIEIDAENGLRLNGRKLKLLGGCIHHDQSLLGACAFPRAEERKIQILKNSGYNAIRTAHNPPSTALLNACDQIGMLVIDESFDMWRTQKRPLDYHLYFEQWWRQDTRAMVMRDRNHPSVYCWSIGNEVHELLGASNGVHWTKVQADYVRLLDSTRPVSASANGFTALVPGKPPVPHDIKLEMQGKPRLGLPINGEDLWGEQTKAAAAELDLFGYNYMYGRYADDKVKFPQRVIHATETHPYHTYDYWQAMIENDHVIGDFIWTAYDNLGEAGAGRVIEDLDEPMHGLTGNFPWMSCWQGDHDLSGDRRPQSYYRKVMWGLDKGIHLFATHPSNTGKPFYGMGWHWEDVQRSWTFEPEYMDKPVKVQAYADCDEVEFLLNGTSLGKVKPEKLTAVMLLDYQPGTIEAVAWKDGRTVASDKLQTTGKPTRIVLAPDRQDINADGMDLSFIAVSLVDTDGIPAVNCPVEISVMVNGAGCLAGLGSGNPKTTENYGTGKRITFDGRALVCVRASKTAGDIQIKVSADGLEPGVSIVHSKTDSRCLY